MNSAQQNLESPVILPSPDSGFGPRPAVMTEEEPIRFLRIHEISSVVNHCHVTENLNRVHGLPENCG